MERETILKMRAQHEHPKPYHRDVEPADTAGCAAQAQGLSGALGSANSSLRSDSPESILERALYDRAASQRQSENRVKEIEFYTENPAFLDFISLIRQGVIQLY